MNKGYSRILYGIQMLLDLIFPSYCLGCHIRGSFLCETCLTRVRRNQKPTEHSVYALYDYRDPLIKKAIWNLKYYNKRGLADILGIKLYENCIEELSDIQIFNGGNPIYVIPVPVSKHKNHTRGYNQAELLARVFASNASFLHLRTDIVQKRKDTTPQARITHRYSRLQNIKGAFSTIGEVSLSGISCIIIDDVTTTGGTVTEIKNILKKCGAKNIYIFAVAH